MTSISIIKDVNTPSSYILLPTGVTISGWTKSYKTYTEMKKDKNPPDYCVVEDASADPTVDRGSAVYKVSKTNGRVNNWIKIYEEEMMDQDLTEILNRFVWNNLVGKPSSTPSDIDDAVLKQHQHQNKSILDKLNASTDGQLIFNGQLVVDKNTINALYEKTTALSIALENTNIRQNLIADVASSTQRVADNNRVAIAEIQNDITDIRQTLDHKVNKEDISYITGISAIKSQLQALAEQLNNITSRLEEVENDTGGYDIVYPNDNATELTLHKNQWCIVPDGGLHILLSEDGSEGDVIKITVRSSALGSSSNEEITGTYITGSIHDSADVPIVVDIPCTIVFCYMNNLTNKHTDEKESAWKIINHYATI